MVKVAAVFHPPPPRRDTDARPRADEVARARRVTLRFTPDEAAKHGIELGPFVEIVDELGDDVDLCIVLGGDGTILTALRRYAGTGVPVFAVNYGEVGFLATIDPNGLDGGLRARVRGRVRHDRAADDLGRPPATAPGARSTTSPSTARRACASPTSPTRSRARRSAACAATAS